MSVFMQPRITSCGRIVASGSFTKNKRLKGPWNTFLTFINDSAQSVNGLFIISKFVDFLKFRPENKVFR